MRPPTSRRRGPLRRDGCGGGRPEGGAVKGAVQHFAKKEESGLFYFISFWLWPENSLFAACNQIVLILSLSSRVTGENKQHNYSRNVLETTLKL